MSFRELDAGDPFDGLSSAHIDRRLVGFLGGVEEDLGESDGDLKQMATREPTRCNLTALSLALNQCLKIPNLCGNEKTCKKICFSFLIYYSI